MLVHVITPRGTRYEYNYRDGAAAETILTELAGIKRQFGFNGTVKKVDDFHPHGKPTDFADESSGFTWDNPETVVTILESTKGAGGVDVATLDAAGKPIEAKRLKGPPVPAAAPEPRPKATDAGK